MIFLRLFVLVLSFSLVSLPCTASAADVGTAFSRDLLGNNKGAEYISGDYPGAVMMKVNIWGAVQKPGIHYVPVKTDIITMLSYAGGPVERARMGDVTIRRVVGGKPTVIDVDIDDILDSSKATTPPLEANDTIVIPKSSPMFSENTMQLITVVASMLTITLGSLILKKELAGK
ncbi:MAG TPA: hypothetical protein VIH99_11960 [Bdellovibrionota bacterium]|jgi:hypothetical protein